MRSAGKEDIGIGGHSVGDERCASHTPAASATASTPAILTTPPTGPTARTCSRGCPAGLECATRSRPAGSAESAPPAASGSRAARYRAARYRAARYRAADSRAACPRPAGAAPASPTSPAATTTGSGFPVDRAQGLLLVRRQISIQILRKLERLILRQGGPISQRLELRHQ